MGLKLNQSVAPSAPAVNKAEVYLSSVDGLLHVIYPDGRDAALDDDAANGVNYLINGGFEYAQRQAQGTLTTYSATAGRAFAADRWGITNENASVQYQRVDSSAATEIGLNARYYGKFKKITSAGKMVVSQVIEGSNSAPLRGRTVRFQAKMRYTVAAAMTVRMALLYNTAAGTVDSIPATFVSAFGAVGTDPTWGANITALAPTLPINGSVSGLGMTCVLTGAWVNYSACFTIPATAKNVLAVIWTNGQPAANDELNITECMLSGDVRVRNWNPIDPGAELLQCQRYYYKTFNTDTAPAQGVGLALGEVCWCAIAAGAVAQRSPAFKLPTRMRTTGPTLTTYNPATASAQIRDETAAADCTATASALGPVVDWIAFNCTGAAGTTVGGRLRVHYTLDAEI